MPGISRSGTATPGLSSSGLSSSASPAPFASNSGPFPFGLSIVDIEVLNEFSLCHPH